MLRRVQCQALGRNPADAREAASYESSSLIIVQVFPDPGDQFAVDGLVYQHFCTVGEVRYALYS